MTADITARSATGEAGVMTRMANAGDSGYLVRYVAASGLWEAGTLNAGTFTQLGSWTGTIPVGGTAHLVVSQNGSSLIVAIDGSCA